MANKQSLLILIFRLGFGVNFFLHGLLKLNSDQEAFKNFILTKFSGTIIPSAILEPFAICLPYIELILGALLIVGLFYFWAIFLSMFTMICLMSGMIIMKDWQTVGIQLVYLIYLFLLGANISGDAFNIDQLFKRND